MVSNYPFVCLNACLFSPKERVVGQDKHASRRRDRRVSEVKPWVRKFTEEWMSGWGWEEQGARR